MSRKVSAAGGSEKSMVALQLPSLMPPLYRGDGSLLKFLEFTVFTFATPSDYIYIYIYYVRAIPLLATINTTSTVDDLEKRIKENIAWNVELIRAFRGTLTRTKNKYNGVISRGRERRQSVSWSVLLFLLLSQPERRNSPRLEKRKRRLNRRKIEGETCLGGPSLAARKNYFRRLLTSLLDEKEAASLRSRPRIPVAWKTASPILPPFPPLARVLASGRYSPPLKSMWVPEGRRSRRKRSYTPYSTRFTRRRGPLCPRRCSMTIILFSHGREKVWLENGFYFGRVIFIPFPFFFFSNDTCTTPADEIALRTFQLCNFRVSPVSRISIILFNLIYQRNTRDRF